MQVTGMNEVEMEVTDEQCWNVGVAKKDMGYIYTVSNTYKFADLEKETCE